MYCFEVKDTFLVFISCKSIDSLKKPSGRDRRGRGGRQMGGEEPGGGNAK